MIVSIRGAVGVACAAASICCPRIGAQTVTTIAGIQRLTPAAAVEQHNRQCADRGKDNSGGGGLDSLTNFLKNRIDVPARYRLTTIPTLLKLPFDASDGNGGDMPRTRNSWAKADFTRTARYQSRAVAVDGYIIAVNREGGESTNCGLTDTSWVDYHMWVVKTEPEAHARDKSKAIVAEITPRVRRGHAAAFDVDQMRQWARDGVPVRVSGWLFLDPDHPDDTRPDRAGHAASRGTIWEIHPITKIEPVPKG